MVEISGLGLGIDIVADMDCGAYCRVVIVLAMAEAWWLRFLGWVWEMMAEMDCGAYRRVVIVLAIAEAWL